MRPGIEYIENGAGDLETRQQSGGSTPSSRTAIGFTVEVNDNYELLVLPFTPCPRRDHPAGRLRLQRRDGVGYTMGHAAAGLGQRSSLLRGGYYGGDITTGRFSSGRVTVTKRFSLEPRLSINRRRAAHTERLHDQAVRVARRLRLLAAHVCQRAAAIQLRGPHLQQQPALPLGIPARQRVLRRLDRRAGHAARTASACAIARSC